MHLTSVANYYENKEQLMNSSLCGISYMAISMGVIWVVREVDTLTEVPR